MPNLEYHPEKLIPARKGPGMYSFGHRRVSLLQPGDNELTAEKIEEMQSAPHIKIDFDLGVLVPPKKTRRKPAEPDIVAEAPAVGDEEKPPRRRRRRKEEDGSDGD